MCIFIYHVTKFSGSHNRDLKHRNLYHPLHLSPFLAFKQVSQHPNSYQRLPKQDQTMLTIKKKKSLTKKAPEFYWFTSSGPCSSEKCSFNYLLLMKCDSCLISRSVGEKMVESLTQSTLANGNLPSSATTVRQVVLRPNKDQPDFLPHYENQL